MATQTVARSGERSAGDAVFVVAWVLCAIVAIPALATATWGLVGRYSFKYLPFQLVAVAIPLAVSPLVAVALTRVRGPLRRPAVGAAVAITLLSLGAAGLAVLGLGFTLPLSLLDDSGHAPDNFSSLLSAAVLALMYALVAVFFVIAVIALARAQPSNSEIAPLLRRLVMAVALTVGVIGLADLVGAVNGARLDAQGIPVGPVGVSWLASRSESTTIYPSAQVVEHSLSGEERELHLSRTAYAQSVFLTSDSALQVSVWYAERLATRGWKPNGYHSSPTQESEWDFNRGTREVFQLLSCAQAHVQVQAQRAGQQCFWTRYWVFPLGEPHL